MVASYSTTRNRSGATAAPTLLVGSYVLADAARREALSPDLRHWQIIKFFSKTSDVLTLVTLVVCRVHEPKLFLNVFALTTVFVACAFHNST